MLLTLLPLLAATLVSAQTANSSLNVGPISFAGFNNYLFRDNTTSCQLVVTNNATTGAPSRFITAFPDGNTGALVYFVPVNASAAIGATLDYGSVKSVVQGMNQTGVTGNLSLSGDVNFGVTLNYVESGGTVFHTIFNYTLGNYSNSSVTLVRNWINGTTVQYLTFSSASNALFNVTPSSNTTLPPNITISRQNTSSNSTITFLSTFNFTTTTPSTPTVPLIGLGASQLFLSTPPANASSSLNSTLTAIQNATTSSQIAFLAYTDKFLAGGWRFLTYFGRDTLLALRLLLPVISPTSAEAILGAVLERTNTTGALCHEETIGDYASFVNINNNQSNLGNTPSYSYVMLDTDFLLLPVMAEYYANNASGAQAFLNKTSSLMNGTYSQLLLKNVDHVLNLSMAFGENATKGNLVPIRDPTVGDWRDSNTGLGYGIYPFDVNTALIPAALRAIAVLANASIIPSNYSSNATRYAQVWETQSSQYFEVSISPSAATSSLNTYVTAANLSSALLYGAGSLNTSSNSSYGWGATNQVIGDDAGSLGNSTFYGLSIDRNGSVVEVLNSDLGFVMLYGNNVSARVVQAVVDAMQPYPRGTTPLTAGLLTNVGMVVANPAYSTNASHTPLFSNLMYHGAVSWSFQQGLMASGISRQLALCNITTSNTQLTPVTGPTPTWCGNTALVSALGQAQLRLWASIAGSASVLYTEVWSPVFNNATGNFTIGDLGAISPTGTEGDAIQTWSYGALALENPITGRAVAGGFP